MGKEIVTTWTCDGTHPGGPVQSSDPVDWFIANYLGDGGFGVYRLDPDDEPVDRLRTLSYLCSRECLCAFLDERIKRNPVKAEAPPNPFTDDDVPF
jgi:hypothetical protein